MRFDRRLLLALAIPLLLILTVLARNIKGNHGSSYCEQSPQGQTAQAAIQAYVRACGTDYSLGDGGTAQGGQDGFDAVERYKVDFQGQILLVLVGQRSSGQWNAFSVEGPP